MIFIKILKNTIQIKKKILIAFDDMIDDLLTNKKLNPIVTKLFIRGKKTCSCFYYTILLRCSKKY